MHTNSILTLDFGSQYTQLIARRVRELGVYCELLPFNTPTNEILRRRPAGLILSGGPSSVYADAAPRLPAGLLQQINCPILGICYGLQALMHELGGKVFRAANREFGLARLKIENTNSFLFDGIPKESNVWMSHGDHVESLPNGFIASATTKQSLSAVEALSKRIFGVQFHPEVVHSEYGKQIFANFVEKICQAENNWTPQNIINDQIESIRKQAPTGNIVTGLSGGVDSTIAATLVAQAVGERQTCIFVNNGLLRESEFEDTLAAYKELSLNVRGVDASDAFLSSLANIVDPEAKRKSIGRTFIEVFDREAMSIGDVDYLVQGTLYPDVIESISVNGPSATIKSHHNVGGLPEGMKLKVIEPLRELFKDEVRQIGRQLGVPESIVNRHPFPGPGLAIRIIGEVTEARLKILRAANKIVEDEVRFANLNEHVWQAFAVLLPIQTVGVMGDARTYEQVIAVRAVTSLDGMTADWARLPQELLETIASRIISEVRGINRVVYDITSKPPGTIEWE